MLFVSDANIFIDLEKIGLLGEFDKLGIQIATSDFVLNELHTPQKELAEKMKIEICALSPNELAEFLQQYQALGRVKISVQDYSIYYFASKYGGKVLSNDKALRNFAKRNMVGVQGIFYILDLIIQESTLEQHIIKQAIALLLHNSWLPKNEINKRLEQLI